MLKSTAAAVASVLLCASISRADITYNGDITPDDPSTGQSFPRLYIGALADGDLTVDDGSDVVSQKAYVGFDQGVEGQLTVTGPGSEFNATSRLYVGYEGTGQLAISDSGFVGANLNYVGYDAGSSGSVKVDGPGSEWELSLSAVVGYHGQGSVEVSDGGVISGSPDSIYLGRYSSGGGTVTITGEGSAWDVRDSYVGYAGAGELNVLAGGSAPSNYFIHIGYDPGSSGSVNVSGPGSTMKSGTPGTSGELLHVGNSGHGVLNVSDGGSVICTYAAIAAETGSDGRTVVSGATSNLTAAGDLSVARYGQGLLEIADDGEVIVAGNTYVAQYPGSSGTIDLDNGVLTTGGLISAGQDLTGTGVINANGIVTDANLVFNAIRGLQQTFILDGPARNIQINLDVNGSGAIGAGHSGSGQMLLADGLTLPSAGGFLGYNAGSDGTATITGRDSTWLCAGDFHVGYYGSGTLDIADAARVENTGDVVAVIGQMPGSSGRATLTNGAEWKAPRLEVGSGGDGTLHVSGGSSVHNSTQTLLARQPGTTGTITVTGDGSFIGLGSDTYLQCRIGYYGSGRLDILDSAHAHCSDNVWLADKSDSTGLLKVDGQGSMLTVEEDIFVGHHGQSEMEITNGAKVYCLGATLGYQENSRGVVTVSGPGSVWNVGQYDPQTGRFSGSSLWVGQYGHGVLNISDGGSVDSKNGVYTGMMPGSTGRINFDNGSLSAGGFIGAGDSLQGTGVMRTTGLVTDIDLVFASASDLSKSWKLDGPGQDITIVLEVNEISAMGAGGGAVGTTRILNGVDMKSPTGYVGYGRGSDGYVLVSGPETSWTLSKFIYVGLHGRGTLDINDGALVQVSDNSFFADLEGSSGTVTVSGPGSTMNMAGRLWLADHYDTDAQLNVLDGASVYVADYVKLADVENSRASVRVSGQGSRLIVDGSTLRVGGEGHGVLNITDGGFASGPSCNVSGEPNSISEMTVAGAGSMWVGSLGVGYRGNATMSITGGGIVSGFRGSVGARDRDTISAASISGPGSTWAVLDTFWISARTRGGSSELTIDNGGLLAVKGTMHINPDGEGDCFVNITSGGMLAIFGQGDDSLFEYLSLIEGTNAIRYWDDSIADWADIGDATIGEDYNLAYLDPSLPLALNDANDLDLRGYTILTVGVPEPLSLAILATAAPLLLRRRRKNRPWR